MKTLTLVLFVALLLLPMLSSANTNIVVFPAELSVSFQAVPGRVVLAGDQVLFWSESAAFPSFYFTKAGVKRSTIAGGVLSVEIENAIQIQDGSRSRFDLRLIGEHDVAAIERWFNQPAGTMPVSGMATASGSTAAAAASAAASAAAVGGLAFDAEHTRMFGGNRNGKLVFGEQSINWECLDDATLSRTWDYKAIRRLDRKNAYELVVDTFGDGKYSFKMTGKPLGNEDFSTITNYLAAARSASRQ